MRFTLNVRIGGASSYGINFVVNYSMLGNGGLHPKIEYRISYNDREFFNDHCHLMGPNSPKDLSRSEIVRSLEGVFLNLFGGVDTDPHFMDFETYTLASLQNSNVHSYFSNIYLAIMCNLKERGMQMPPILAKDNDLQEYLSRGDITSVSERLAILTALYRSNDPRISKHIEYEKRNILRVSRENASRTNPFVALETLFPQISYRVVEQGEQKHGKINIVVVENDALIYGAFTQKVSQTLEQSRQFAGAKIISCFGIGPLADYCVTGKINVVVFDQLAPDVNEMIWQQRIAKTSNPTALIEIIPTGNITQLGDGTKYTDAQLSKEAEGFDLRRFWRDILIYACEKAGVQAPKFLTISTAQGLENCAQYINLLLKE